MSNFVQIIWNIVFYSTTLTVLAIFIISFIAFYYYIILFLHIGDSRQYTSMLSEILAGGILKQDYELNLIKIEEYADNKTVSLLKKIILTSKLLKLGFILAIILIIPLMLLQ